MIFDAKYRHNAMAIAINMMTSDASQTELECQFGRAKLQLLIRVWNLRITYPYRDIVLHANDVNSCFRQLKHHSDVMGAFSYILGDFMFLQCGLTFGSDFSPANWEVVRRIAEQLAEAFFEDKSLVKKLVLSSGFLVLRMMRIFTRRILRQRTLRSISRSTRVRMSTRV